MVRWFVLLLLVSSACGPVHMRVPAALEPGKLVVHRGGEAVRFADFAAEKVMRSDTERWTASFWTERRAAKQIYSYEFVHGATHVAVHCESRWGDKSLTRATLSLVTDHMRVDCYMGDRPILSVGDMTEGRHVGLAQVTAPVMEVRSSHRREEAPIDDRSAVGYEFYLNGELLGAVQLDNDPTVWMIPGLPPGLRYDVALASAALILFEDISESDH
jgi:hypothetical protein